MYYDDSIVNALVGTFAIRTNQRTNQKLQKSRQTNARKDPATLKDKFENERPCC